MIKRSFLFLWLCMPLLSAAQSSDDFPLIEDHKASFGLQFSYDKYKYVYTGDDFENAFNYSAGFVFRKNFGINLEAKTGLLLSEKGFTWIEKLFPDIPEFNLDVYYTIHARYIDVPLFLGYRYMINRSFVIAPSGGFLFSFLAGSDLSSDIGDTDLHYDALTEGLNPFLFSYSVSLAIEWHLGKKYFVQAEPYFRKSFVKVHEQFLDKAPVSYGLGFGLYKKF